MSVSPFRSRCDLNILFDNTFIYISQRYNIYLCDVENPQVLGGCSQKMLNLLESIFYRAPQVLLG